MSYKKLVAIAVISIMSLFAITGCKKSGDAKTDENVLVIGGQNPETGPMADYGSKTVLGAKLAFEEINANGGINLSLIHI